MKMSNLYAAREAEAQLTSIDFQIYLVSTEGGSLKIAIDGTYQDNEIIEAVRPAVVAELESRKAKIIARLKELGVDPEA